MATAIHGILTRHGRNSGTTRRLAVTMRQGRLLGLKGPSINIHLGPDEELQGLKAGSGAAQFVSTGSCCFGTLCWDPQRILLLGSEYVQVRSLRCCDLYVRAQMAGTKDCKREPSLLFLVRASLPRSGEQDWNRTE